MIVDSRSAHTGTSYLGFTLRQACEKGIPPSRENAHVQRDAAVSEPTAAKNQMPRTVV
jgi:hypothetical protein